MKRIATLVAVLSLPAGLACAQQQIEDRRPAPARGTVDIENPTGTVTVTGWEREEVEVKGALGKGVEPLDFAREGNRTRIEVQPHGHAKGSRSDIEVRVPAGSSLNIESVDGAILVTGVKGALKLETINGRIEVQDAGTEDIEASTVNGRLDITCTCKRVEAESVNGMVTVRQAGGEIAASTVNGRLNVSGGTFSRAHMETVNGAVGFDGDLAAKARLEIETVGGAVEVTLPKTVSAEFQVTTVSGDIATDLAPSAKAVREPGEAELRFTLGSGSATVNINTLSGSVTIQGGAGRKP